MQIISEEQAVAFATPNAVMRTYASAATTGSDVAVWRVELPPGAAGPWHSVDGEQVAVVLSGRPRISGDHGEQALAPGDGVVLPAGAQRRMSNPAAEPAVLLACSRPGARATPRGRDAVPIPWAR